MRPKFSWASTRRLIDLTGSSAQVLEDVFSDELFGGEFEAAIESAKQHIETLSSRGIYLASIYGSSYPRQLSAVHDAPAVLYWQGQHSPADDRAVAIVGTRNPDAWGLGFSSQLAQMFADSQIPVVSGLARGVDSSAMASSLRHGGRTVGVIGSGHNRVYPKENAALQASVSKHLLLSQFAPDTPPSRQTFPMRNAVMSGFTSATVIVQAGETSGTKIQAKAAVRHGRPLVLTAAVMRSAEWARGLVASGYDVRVVSTPEEAFSVVKSLQARAEDVSGEWSTGSLFA
ncbi:DNA-processing protein DprA [Clavibacter michiganensis]|uniref:DNA-processing protein DprA n=1 Tax=Clavibacter michiganensis TaxID=28447 RepID=UPI00345CFBF1